MNLAGQHHCRIHGWFQPCTATLVVPCWQSYRSPEQLQCGSLIDVDGNLDVSWADDAGAALLLCLGVHDDRCLLELDELRSDRSRSGQWIVQSEVIMAENGKGEPPNLSQESGRSWQITPLICCVPVVSSKGNAFGDIESDRNQSRE